MLDWCNVTATNSNTYQLVAMQGTLKTREAACEINIHWQINGRSNSNRGDTTDDTTFAS